MVTGDPILLVAALAVAMLGATVFWLAWSIHRREFYGTVLMADVDGNIL